MIDSDSLIGTARKLLEGVPSEADIRRSVSTAYYALFHHVCQHFSAIVLQPATGNYHRARQQAYRYLDHGPAKQRCLEAARKDRKFPAGIVAFAETFTDLQVHRNEADYDPSFSLTLADAHSLIGDAEAALAAFDAEPVEAQRAFVIFLGLRPKNR